MPEDVLSTGGVTILPALPGAAREARSVATLLQTAPLGRESATESAVRTRLPRAGVVHFATHGIAYSGLSGSRESFLAFGADADAEHDGRFTMGELQDDRSLRLSADLVVLSACQTGVGEPTATEGVFGFQRAFLERGANTIVASLWNVSDEATSLLMEQFYRHLVHDTDRPGKAEALRRAQQDVRITPGFRNARFWAGFQLMGQR
jgi:CHAT domain-containing protein